MSKKSAKPAILRAYFKRKTEFYREYTQGLPDNFTNVELNGRKLSYSKRCGLCGNGWTLPVIKHIFQGIEY